MNTTNGIANLHTHHCVDQKNNHRTRFHDGRSTTRRGAERSLKNRHIQLIALGGAIGTGLFLGVADTIKRWRALRCCWAMPSAAHRLPHHAPAGRGWVVEGVPGSFGHFAYSCWGHSPAWPPAGTTGYSVLVAHGRLTAVGIYVQYWSPNPDLDVSSLLLRADQTINLSNVKAFGEMEFWFAIIKVVAIYRHDRIRRLDAVSGSGSRGHGQRPLGPGSFFPTASAGW
ncbi:hypothetical protein ACNKHQ_00695 [Shigella flexneri]